MLKLSDKVSKVPLIGPKYEALLNNLGIFSIKDIFYHFPVRYADTSKFSLISDLSLAEKKTILCTITNMKNIRTKFRKHITEATASDKSGEIEIIWFNQPFISKALKIGSKVLLNGKLNQNRNKPQLYSPEYEVYKEGRLTHLGRIVPIYSTTEGVTSKWLRSRIYFLLNEHTYLLKDIKNQLPQNIEECYNLIQLAVE